VPPARRNRACSGAETNHLALLAIFIRTIAGRRTWAAAT